jgi:hypothetical protein
MIRFIFLLLLLSFPVAAWAHPHVFVTYTVKVIADKAGGAVLEFTWKFDRMFSEMALDSLGFKPKEAFPENEAKQIEEKAFHNLKDYHYYIDLFVDGAAQHPQAVQGFKAAMKDKEFIYTFTIPVPPVKKTFYFELYDPEYYVEIIPPMVKKPSDRPGSFMAPEEWMPGEFVKQYSKDNSDSYDCVTAKGKGITSVWGVFFPQRVTCTRK